MIGIYKITNLINNKVYIGQSVNIYKRWKEHKRKWKYDTSKILYKAFRKYGVDNFKFEILEECSTDELNEKEIYYIRKYKSYIGWNDSWGYNSTEGGEGTRGRKLTEEQKINLSNKTKERGINGENNPNYNNHALAGENHFMYGKHHSEETKRKISESHKGIGKDGKNPSAKKIICNGVLFNCIKECANFYGVNYNTFKCYVNKTRKMPKKWAKMGLMYYDIYLQLNKPSTTIENKISE